MGTRLKVRSQSQNIVQLVASEWRYLRKGKEIWFDSMEGNQRRVNESISVLFQIWKLSHFYSRLNRKHFSCESKFSCQRIKNWSRLFQKNQDNQALEKLYDLLSDSREKIEEIPSFV